MANSPIQLVNQTTRHAVYLERYKASAVKEYTKLLKKIKTAVLERLAGENITEWGKIRLKTELRIINGALKNISKGIIDLMYQQVKKLGEYEVEFEIKSINNLIKYNFVAPSDTQIFSAITSFPLSAQGPSKGLLLESFIEDWGKRTLRRYENAIRLGFARGITTNQLISDIFASMGENDLTRKDLDAVCRTALAHSANISRNELYRRNTDLITGVEIVATLDIYTTVICRTLDGEVYPVEEGPRPPFHIRCRTATAPVLDSAFDILEKDATRAARDPESKKIEYISAKSKYYNWLKLQPSEFQNDVLGIKRGKLFREGGLSIERFRELQLDKNFEPLTLEEMRKKEPLAFQKAGI